MYILEGKMVWFQTSMFLISEHSSFHRTSDTKKKSTMWKCIYRKRCNVWHLWEQKAVGYHYFMDIRTFKLKCILGYLATLQTDLPI